MMSFFEIQSTIGEIENNSLLFEEKNFLKRIETIDFIAFQIIGEIDKLLLEKPQQENMMLLKYRAEKVKAALQKIDVKLFQKLRENIGRERHSGKGFKNLISEYFDFNLYYSEHQEEIGYDNLDIFINQLFYLQSMPELTIELEPEMVYYQKTPARIVFELTEKCDFAEEDVFFDLGSGLGQVAILINFLTGIKTKGIEIEPSFCDYARRCAAEFKLSNVSFINDDARNADYSEGTIFFMFTPFKGKILDDVLEILRQQSEQRKIKIITYGHCTAHVASQSWLEFATPNNDEIFKLSVFKSSHD